jgi:lipopolysaccharide biosynthesis protein
MQDEQSNMLSIKGKINLKSQRKKAYKFLDKQNISSIKYIFMICFMIVFNIRIEIIEINNEISLYEKNKDYSKFETEIKTIALYLPQFHSIKENDKWWGRGFTEWYNVRKAKPLYCGHHQPRIPGDNLHYLGYYDLSDVESIKKQINLAKAHGIYGFGIYYYWFSGKRLLEKPLDIILKNIKIEFKFLLIWANEDWTRRWNGYEGTILIKQEYKENDMHDFIKDIKKYIIDKRYIKINDKPVIGLYEPKKIPNLSNTIFNWRKEAKKIGFDDIYIIVCLNSYSFEEMKNLELFNGVYEFSPRDSLQNSAKPYLLYMNTLYKKIDFIKANNNFPLYRGSMLEFDNSPRKKNEYVIYENYSPEQFYMNNKKIIEWTRSRYDKKNRFIFINAWNEWGEGTYLEPDKKYGYASINSLSKALFNKTFTEININSSIFNKLSIIAVQVNLYNDYSINEIINKINNIPFDFDLFISINSLTNKNKVNEQTKKHSKAKKIEIVVLQDKERNFIPFLIQMRNYIKNYKYICHIHTKNSLFLDIEEEWNNYLINNLLGNENIVSEILTDFEENIKLGIVFPENYYKIMLKLKDKLSQCHYFLQKTIIKQYFGKLLKLNIGQKLEFPLGNMFWAKTNSIFQIFEKEFQYKIEKEFKIRKNICGIEIIWMLFVKINGFYYKNIFKHF